MATVLIADIQATFHSAVSLESAFFTFMCFYMLSDNVLAFVKCLELVVLISSAVKSVVYEVSM